jgi:hypothetical protein
MQTDSKYRGAGTYPRELVPAARPGDVVRMEPGGGVYMVDTMIPQPGFKIFDSDASNSVTVSANSTNSDNEATDMEMDDNWLGQYRLLQPGNDINPDVEVRIDMGGKTAPLYTNKNKRGEYTRDTLTPVGHDGSSTQVPNDFNLHLSELYVFEDEMPYFTFENTTAGDETVQGLYWSGFQYRLEPFDGTPGGHVEPIPTQRVLE